MAQDVMEAVEAIKPLSFWQKLKAGVKGFVHTAMDYAPRGVLFSGMAIGASALIAPYIGYDLFGVMDNGTFSLAKAGTAMLQSLAIGGTISGGVGAYKAVRDAGQIRSAEIAAQEGLLERGRQRGPQRQQNVGYNAGYVPPSGLPAGHKGIKQQTITG